MRAASNEQPIIPLSAFANGLIVQVLAAKLVRRRDAQRGPGLGTEHRVVHIGGQGGAQNERALVQKSLCRRENAMPAKACDA